MKYLTSTEFLHKIASKNEAVTDAHVTGSVILIGIDLSAHVICDNVIFENLVDASGAQFGSSVAFTDCTFKESLKLTSASVGGELVLRRSTFYDPPEGKTKPNAERDLYEPPPDYRSQQWEFLTVMGRIDASRIRVAGSVNLGNCNVEGSIIFHGASVGNRLRIDRKTPITQQKFGGRIYMRQARLNGDLELSPWFDPTNANAFERTHIHGAVSLGSSRIEGRISMRGARIDGGVHAIMLILKGRLLADCWRHPDAKDGSQVLRTELGKTREDSMVLTDAEINNAVWLRGAKLKGAFKLVNTTIKSDLDLRVWERRLDAKARTADGWPSYRTEIGKNTRGASILARNSRISGNVDMNGIELSGSFEAPEIRIEGRFLCVRWNTKLEANSTISPRVGKSTVDSDSISINGAHIQGCVRLQGRYAGGLRLEPRKVEGAITISFANLGKGTGDNSINLNGANILGRLRIQRCYIKAKVTSKRARILDNVKITQSEFTGTKLPSFVLSGAEVGGEWIIDHCAYSSRIIAEGVRIKGAVRISNSTFDCSVLLTDANFDGSVHLGWSGHDGKNWDKPTIFKESVSLRRSKIAADLNLNGLVVYGSAFEESSPIVQSRVIEKDTIPQILTLLGGVSVENEEAYRKSIQEKIAILTPSQLELWERLKLTKSLELAINNPISQTRKVLRFIERIFKEKKHWKDLELCRTKLKLEQIKSHLPGFVATVKSFNNLQPIEGEACSDLSFVISEQVIARPKGDALKLQQIQVGGSILARGIKRGKSRKSSVVVYGTTDLINVRCSGHIALANATFVGDVKMDNTFVGANVALVNSRVIGDLHLDGVQAQEFTNTDHRFNQEITPFYPKVTGELSFVRSKFSKVTLKLANKLRIGTPQHEGAITLTPRRVMLNSANFSQFTLLSGLDPLSQPTFELSGFVASNYDLEKFMNETLTDDAAIRPQYEAYQPIKAASVRENSWIVFRILARFCWLIVRALRWLAYKSFLSMDKLPFLGGGHRRRLKKYWSHSNEYTLFLAQDPEFDESTYDTIERQLRAEGREEKANDVYLARYYRELDQGDVGLMTWIIRGPLAIFVGGGVRTRRIVLPNLIAAGFTLCLYSYPEAVEHPATFVMYSEALPLDKDNADKSTTSKGRYELAHDINAALPEGDPKKKRFVWTNDNGRPGEKYEWGKTDGFWLALNSHIPLVHFWARDEWEPSSDEVFYFPRMRSVESCKHRAQLLTTNCGANVESVSRIDRVLDALFCWKEMRYETWSGLMQVLSYISVPLLLTAWANIYRQRSNST